MCGKHRRRRRSAAGSERTRSRTPAFLPRQEALPTQPPRGWPSNLSSHLPAPLLPLRSSQLLGELSVPRSGALQDVSVATRADAAPGVVLSTKSIFKLKNTQTCGREPKHNCQRLMQSQVSDFASWSFRKFLQL